MNSKVTEITYDIRLRPGESFALPEDAAAIIGPGHWLVSIRPVDRAAPEAPIRDHTAFLGSYAPEDEGLYDDYSAG